MQSWTDRIPRAAKKAAVSALYLASWQGLSGIVGKSLLLPGPIETLAHLLVLLRQRETWTAAGMTLLRVLAGYALGVTGGAALAALTARSRILDAVLRPLRGVVKATPVTSFILLALLWLSSGLVPVCIAFLMVLPIVWANVHEALAGVDPQLLEMAAAFHLPWRTLFTNHRSLREAAVPCRLHNVARVCMEVRRRRRDHRFAETIRGQRAVSFKAHAGNGGSVRLDAACDPAFHAA